jgi:putative FmdB family regulatory protein
MPLYDFACARCTHRFEARTGFDEPAPPCPECGKSDSQRVISGFASSRSPGLRGLAARRSDDSRRIREQARDERREQRRTRPS